MSGADPNVYIPSQVPNRRPRPITDMLSEREMRRLGRTTSFGEAEVARRRWGLAKQGRVRSAELAASIIQMIHTATFPQEVSDALVDAIRVRTTP